MSPSVIADSDDLNRLDESGITYEHWKILFISGIGVALHLPPWRQR